ncbi:hypothetical protein O6H91_01G121900 [Diphasiastrum complanatum]|uniref:Uncharacterized protein n=1 Tax=Diphasiastrum complanatum TaxID=34168 RepID=A0ACC2EVP1_DIPCM|nr:hypothetical protein O6H91_01G121900 [Diphasiastrum complanatum]
MRTLHRSLNDENISSKLLHLESSPTSLFPVTNTHFAAKSPQPEQIDDPKLKRIVVEAGRLTNLTASLLAQSGINFFHLSIDKRMPVAWNQHRTVKSLMRIEALRFVREQRLDGIIIFVDDSNTHSLQLFDEVVRCYICRYSSQLCVNKGSSGDPSFSVQGPACNESCHVIGWHLLPTYEQNRKFDAGERALLVKDLKWAGFVLNSRMLWEGAEKPDYISDWDEWILSNLETPSNPLGIVKDEVFVEPLGNYGRREVLL